MFTPQKTSFFYIREKRKDMAYSKDAQKRYHDKGKQFLIRFYPSESVQSDIVQSYIENSGLTASACLKKIILEYIEMKTGDDQHDEPPEI